MICKRCAKFKVFGENCYFYFRNKKECSQFEELPEEDKLAELIIADD